MTKISFKNSNLPDITLSALLFKPEGFSESKQYPAIVVSHPGGGVKEQTASIYAEKLAANGFIAIAFDRSFQGESTGEPRQKEDPYIGTEDISAVVDYLQTLSFVDGNRIGAVGICTGGGYTVNATIQDRRIKAVAGISASNFGDLLRYGWDGTGNPADASAIIEASSNARAEDVKTGKYSMYPLAPDTKEAAPNADVAEAWEYYKTPRAQKANAPSCINARNLSQIALYDAFRFADIFLTQPLLMVVGSKASTKWFSEGLVAKAASTKKAVYVVEGASHVDLYDIPNFVNEAVSQLVPFFTENI